MEVEALTLHEAYPGHHFQLSYMIENDIPLFVKLNSHDETSYEEGWGLYCETLGDYENPLSYYGRLNMEMMRAIRLVIDTGIHYYNWSYEKSYNYFRKYSFDKPYILKKEINRYIAYPGQALSYKIGENVFLQLKKQFKGNIKDFHTKCLKYGSIPLEILIQTFKN